MKRLFFMSLFAITAGLYADYPVNPNLQSQALKGRLAGQQNQPCCLGQTRQSTMPYTTIVNEEAQGPRQNYYYYGADSSNQPTEGPKEGSALFNRDNLRENLNQIRENLRENIQQLRDNPAARENLRSSLQGTYFNKTAQQNAAAADTFNSDTDRALGQRIRDAIKGGWFSRGYEQVSLDVNNGIVTIRGFVATIDDKQTVENTVKKVNGVSNVNNQLTVQANQNASMMNKNQAANEDEDDDDEDDNDFPQDRAGSDADQQINNKIRDALGQGWVAKKFEGIVIRTDKGIVTIEGSVETFDDQRKLNDEIRKIEGVRSVNNNVQIKAKAAK